MRVFIKLTVRRALIVQLCIGVLLLWGSAFGQASGQDPNPDQQAVLRNWSLFAEYHKNQEYRTAIPFGWEVVRLNPTRFRTLYERLAECYYKLYEAEESDLRSTYADTIIMVYDLGIKNLPDKAGWYYLQKGFALENYFSGRDVEAIEAYEKGVNGDFPNVDFYYVDHLGVLYIKNIVDNPEYKMKAVNLYRGYLERDPNNQVALDRLKRIIEDPHELIGIALQKLAADPENSEYIWHAAQAYIQAEEFAGAVPHLEKLTRKDPKSETYITELAKTLQRAGRFREAIAAYERALRLNPDVKENILNIAVCHRELKNFSAARTFAQRAAGKDRTWGRPYLEIAQVYEAAVEQCVTQTKGGWANMKFDDRLVYKLAQENYARAKAVDPKLSTEADTRSRALETLVPQQEDYFFNRDKIRDGKIAIFGSCYEWIGENITVPTKFQ